MNVAKTELIDRAMVLYGDLNDVAGFLRAKQSNSRDGARDPDAIGDVVVTRALAARVESLSQVLATFAAEFRPVNGQLASKLAGDASCLGQHAVVLAGMAGAQHAYGRGWDAVVAQPIATLLEAARAALAHE